MTQCHNGGDRAHADLAGSERRRFKVLPRPPPPPRRRRRRRLTLENGCARVFLLRSGVKVSAVG